MVLPVLVVSSAVPGKWLATLSVQLSQSGSVWCAGYEPSAPVPTTVSLVQSALPLAVVGGQPGAYTVRNLEPDTAYAIYCVAESASGNIMSNSIESTKQVVTTAPEVPILSYIAYASEPSAITATVQLNIRSRVYAVVREYQQGQALPTVEELLASPLQFTVPRAVRTELELANLVHNTQYQVSLYITSMNGLATQMTVAQLTTLVRTAKLICPASENPYGSLPATEEGESASAECALGYSGSLSGSCLTTGEWSINNQCGMSRPHPPIPSPQPVPRRG